MVNGVHNTVTQNSVIYLLKAKIVKPAETAVAGEQHGNKSRPCVFYAVHTTYPYSQKKNLPSLQRGYYLRTMTARVQLKNKTFLFVSLKGLHAKTN
jgi:hypothetical protein